MFSVNIRTLIWCVYVSCISAFEVTFHNYFDEVYLLSSAFSEEVGEKGNCLVFHWLFMLLQ